MIISRKRKGFSFIEIQVETFFKILKLGNGHGFIGFYKPYHGKTLGNENGFIWFYILYHGQILRNGNDIIGLYTRYHGQLAFEGH